MLTSLSLGWVVNLFQRGTASFIRMYGVRQSDLIPATRTRRASQDLAVKGEIEFLSLLSRIQPKAKRTAPVLKSLSLKVPAGTSLVIVGPTGSGKSTLVNLIARLYDVSLARCWLTVVLSEQLLSVLPANLAVAPQETFLFSENYS